MLTRDWIVISNISIGTSEAKGESALANYGLFTSSTLATNRISTPGSRTPLDLSIIINKGPMKKHDVSLVEGFADDVLVCLLVDNSLALGSGAMRVN